MLTWGLPETLATTLVPSFCLHRGKV